MKPKEFRKLKIDEVAVVNDNGETMTAVAEHNEEGGVCECCSNLSVLDAEVILVRNAVTGEIVWQRGGRNESTRQEIRQAPMDRHAERGMVSEAVQPS